MTRDLDHADDGLARGRRSPRPPHPPTRITVAAAVIGPGLVAANVGNDAAGIATYASAGSQYAYGMLCFMVAVTGALGMVQEMAVRLGTHTGKGLGPLIREQFSLSLTTLAVCCWPTPVS
ncbi:hypothetical protein DMH15_01085 [Streptomyces sp. WAC 06725]|uniref:divalent metal cation transporter n=1 Tax=Streptomyces sp. WAC 06725 TaxID=2203209 RepID=UPI000F73BE39|nr:divalent metal cation transporter [Streptomyces sp. WAC 06725]RSO50547.1 hypothetical protein DMH15_01085 [Streptomyces sp. WAC 06725]